MISYLVFYFWQPRGQVNYGELIVPRSLPEVALESIEGAPFRLSELKGQWAMIVVDRPECGESCRAKLVHTRQVRLAQGKESDRIVRVWLLTHPGTPDPALLAEHPGLRVLRAGGSGIVDALPAVSSAADHIYVVDPLGNLMMRFPRDADPRRMLKDMSRLLRHSKWK